MGGGAQRRREGEVRKLEERNDRISTENRACGHLQSWPPDFRLNENHACSRFSSETYAAEWISSLRNGMLKNCVFGTYPASATGDSFVSLISRNSATLRIDNPNCDRSELRLTSRFTLEIELHDSAYRTVALTHESLEAETELEKEAGLGRKWRVQKRLIVGGCALLSLRVGRPSGKFAPIQSTQAREDSSRFLRKDESAPIPVIELSPPVPFHLLGKRKSSTSVLTRSF
jgi:hypothetical protein